MDKQTIASLRKYRAMPTSARSRASDATIIPVIPCRLCLLTSDADTVAASCVSATLALLRGTRVHATTLDADSVDGERLARFDAVLITGGEPRRLRDRLGGRGASAIRAFVAAGGGYIGVCAGAVLATQKAPTLDLLPAVRCVNDNVWWTSGIEGTVVLRGTRSAVPDPADASIAAAFVAGDATHAYHNGPLLRIAKGKTPRRKPTRREQSEQEEMGAARAPTALALFAADVEPWAPDPGETAPKRGQMNGTAAVVSGWHGLGRVLITSVHPEFLPDGALLEAMCLHAVQA